MRSVLEQQLNKLKDSGHHTTLKGMLHGIEKEGLRVNPQGQLAMTDHPVSLGSALTNRHITTDYSEALLEFVTPVFPEPEEALAFLEQLHIFAYRHMDSELIWGGSMPCHIASAADIPIARYGSSNIGRLKHIYRVGLEYRYGKMMQTIAGIHYNFSLPDDFLQNLQAQQQDSSHLQAFRSASYFRLIRNFRRHSWLLLYLFGASPALCSSFMEGRPHQLETLHDHTLYLPHATSLRMSDLGYSNKAQASLDICFNHLNTYVRSLHRATHTPYPPYEKIGVKVDGKYRQINSNILQIENEYYSDIRPKRVINSGETPTHALQHRGVEYVEVRNTDINPFLPIGIDQQQACFLDAFLLTCLLSEDSDISTQECEMINTNQHQVVTRGREPGLKLATLDGESSLSTLGQTVLEAVSHTAGMLDELYPDKRFASAVAAQQEKLANPDQTPSAQVLAALQETGLNHTQWLVEKSQEHKNTLLHAKALKKSQDSFTRESKDSLRRQNELETNDKVSFDQFILDYQNTL